MTSFIVEPSFDGFHYRICHFWTLTKCYEIPDSEMVEIRAICDPNYTGTLYVDAATAESRPGQKVRVIHGVFTGLVGKLTRYKNRYYVVIIVANLGVMIHIPKWYCMKLE